MKKIPTKHLALKPLTLAITALAGAIMAPNLIAATLNIYNGPDLQQAMQTAVAGDEMALAAFKEVAYWISITLTNIMVVLAPDTIIIGGCVAQSGDILLNEIRSAMHERAHLYPASDINIVPATLGFYAGSIGAALYGAITAGAQLSLISTT